MNVGRAITGAMREQRQKDIESMLRWCMRHDGYMTRAYHRLLAYWWWGWDINGRSGLGKPGAEL